MLKTTTIMLISATALALLLGLDSFTAVPASAALQREVGDRIMAYLNEGFTAIQAGNVTGSEAPLVQVNNTINANICNMPICPPGTIRSEEADTLRNPLNQAINVLRSGDATQAQQPLMQVNQSLSALIG
jgi:hypothetical protein